MGVEFSQHKNIVTRMEHMLEQLKLYEHNIAVCSQVNTFWYLQKMEEIKLLQTQMEDALARYRLLRVQLHNESHVAYHRLKADHRLIQKLQKRAQHGESIVTYKSFKQPV